MSHPRHLGKYQITEVLGEGAMGVVYKGFDPDIRRTVALKTIRRQLDDGSGFAASVAARFRNEAQAAGRLAHPGIVAVYDYGEDKGVAFIAMEFVEGQSMAHYVSQRLRFTDADIPGLMSQLLDALQHAHEFGVWHRDIKPANVMLSRGGRLKVADFGIARIDDAGLTQAHTMLGTPTYMAPEQFLGQPIDQRVDVYSAGVLLYLLLTGRPPFVGDANSLMYRVVHEPPVPPSAIETSRRPRFYDALIASALAKDADRRFPSAAAFKQALVSAVGQPIDDTAWDSTIIQVPARPPSAAPAARPPTLDRSAGSSMGSQPPTGWEAAVLAQAETSLARHVGPLAAVLVRRAARECADVPTLYARLAEQITDPKARAEFLGQATGAASATRTGTTGGAAYRPGSHGGMPSTGRTGPTSPLSEALVEQAGRLLALRIGPIARIVVKKAAASTQGRAAFFAQIAASVDDPATRAALLVELAALS